MINMLAFVTLLCVAAISAEYVGERCNKAPVCNGEGVCTVDASQEATWPAAGFCSTVEPIFVTRSPSYSVSASIRNVKATVDKVGHIGIAFNYQDKDNYDVFYVRFHDASYVAGCIRNGQWKMITDGDHGAILEGAKWYKLTVSVIAGTATGFVDGNKMDSWTPNFTPTAGLGAGVTVSNGYGNIADFKGFSMTQLAYITVDNCKSTSLDCTAEGACTLDASQEAVWPADGFCTAVDATRLTTSPDYSVSVTVKNVDSSSGEGMGHPGIVYNYKDSNNYEVFWVRLHEPTFAVGSIKNGDWKMVEGKLPAKLNGGEWYTLAVALRGGKAYAYVDGTKVTQWWPRFKPAAGFMSGVAVANSHGNIVDFKDLTVTTTAEYAVDNCKTDSGACTAEGVCTLDASQENASGWCTALVPNVQQPASNFIVTAAVKNVDSSIGDGMGHPGIVFNYKDSKNYDIFWVRLHDPTFAVGSVQNGKWKVAEAKLPAQLQGSTWYELGVTVIDGKARAYVDGTQVTFWTPKFSSSSGLQAGVAIANSYGNIIEYKDVSVTPLGQVCNANSGNNLALNKPAFQSTTHTHPVSPTADKAVDGNTATRFEAGSCTHTRNLPGSPNPWWVVDLGAPTKVDSVKITNRGFASERLHDFYIGLTNEDPSVTAPSVGNYAVAAIYTGAVDVGATVSVETSGVAGRYLIVQIPGEAEILTLCEVEVYGCQ